MGIVGRTEEKLREAADGIRAHCGDCSSAPAGTSSRLREVWIDGFSKKGRRVHRLTRTVSSHRWSLIVTYETQVLQMERGTVRHLDSQTRKLSSG